MLHIEKESIKTHILISKISPENKLNLIFYDGELFLSIPTIKKVFFAAIEEKRLCFPQNR